MGGDKNPGRFPWPISDGGLDAHAAYLVGVARGRAEGPGIWGRAHSTWIGDEK